MDQLIPRITLLGGKSFFCLANEGVWNCRVLDSVAESQLSASSNI